MKPSNVRTCRSCGEEMIVWMKQEADVGFESTTIPGACAECKKTHRLQLEPTDIYTL